MVIWPLAAQHQFDACCGNFGTSIVDTNGGLQQADKVPNKKIPPSIFALFITATLQRVQSFISGIIHVWINPPDKGICRSVANPT
ncbi:hypothetical protein ACEN88_28155 [Massilia sp. CT11-108]|uniref:hypothetical protein n=1 Tax=Massilia sp. CT11-108 TaxID=3393900 RepID=UPI0039A76636